MLEHADRNDAIELPRHGAIIHQRKPRPLVEPARFRALARQRELLLRQRHAQHVGAVIARQR